MKHNQTQSKTVINKELYKLKLKKYKNKFLYYKKQQ